MRHISKSLSLLSLFVFALFAASEARADPLVVTGGSGSATNSLGGPFTLIGEGFTLNGGTHQGTFAFPALAGQTVNLGSFNLGLDISGGPAVIGGVTYERLVYQGFLRFSAPFVVPDAADALFVITTPFTFTGLLQGCTDPLGAINNCPAGSVVFNSELTGQGLATAVLSSITLEDGTRVYSLRGVRYDFAAQTPEPATVLLLASGLAGVGAAARRKRKRSVNRET